MPRNVRDRPVAFATSSRVRPFAVRNALSRLPSIERVVGAGRTESCPCEVGAPGLTALATRFFAIAGACQKRHSGWDCTAWDAPVSRGRQYIDALKVGPIGCLPLPVQPSEP